jgi:hypothetical protein
VKVLLHQQVEGKQPGDTVDVTDDRAAWLVNMGYASVPGDDRDHVTDAGVPLEQDPTSSADEGASKPAPARKTTRKTASRR